MGGIAAEKADVVIVTDDNPRTEDPGGDPRRTSSPAPRRARDRRPRRGHAAGARLLGAGDVLLVAGKGHETGQIVGDKVIPFSDHEAVRACCTEPQVA